MLRFALRNLVRNRARSALALLGLAASAAGVVLLVAISLGARHMVTDAMDMAKGIVVVEKDAPDPLFSKVKAGLDERLAAVPGVKAAVPEVWALAFSIEGTAQLGRGLANMTAVLGTDPAKRLHLRGGGVFARSMVEGRMYRPDEKDGVVISRRIAKDFKKSVGSTIRLSDHELRVTGIFETGTPIFDNVLGVQEPIVRSIAEVKSSTVSCYYIEVDNGADLDEVAGRIRGVLDGKRLDVKTTTSWGREVSSLVGDLDPYLAAIAFVAGGIGALGVVNTMLMSVRERVRELGVLRATGWRRKDVFRLVLIEAALLGAVGGALGALGGIAGASAAAHFLPIKPFAPAELAAASVAGSVLLGALGGLYPAFYAALLDPIAAIRGGA